MSRVGMPPSLAKCEPLKLFEVIEFFWTFTRRIGARKKTRAAAHLPLPTNSRQLCPAGWKPLLLDVVVSRTLFGVVFWLGCFGVEVKRYHCMK